MRLLFFVTFALFSAHGCGYRLVTAETVRPDIKSISILNQTTDARVTHFVRRELARQLRESTTAAESLHVVIRPMGENVIAVDSSGIGAAETIRIKLQFDVYRKGVRVYRIGPFEIVESYPISQHLVTSTLGREEAYRRAIRDGIVFGVGRLQRFRRRGE